ncbi:MAG: peptidylprolyl isomerase [Nanoarchaeota archaeon]|nr:peptidylprolyl isomerase [Nanoarchaeota archaeon]
MVEKKKEETKEQKAPQPANPANNPLPQSNKGSKSKIIIAIIIVAIIAGVLFYFQKSTTVTEDKTAATVNGQVIKQSELDKLYDTLPEQYKLTTSRESILNQLIEREVLYQEAANSGISLTDLQVKDKMDEILAQQGITKEAYIEMLAQQNLTEDDLLLEYQKRLTIEEYLKKTLLTKVNVTEKDIKEYYNDNKEQFKIKEQVTVKHILFSTEASSDAEQDERAKTILKELTKDNFCEYVSRYSGDQGSLETCGEYTFSADDPYVQEFKDLSFKQAVGAMGIVKTQFGYHIIWTVKKTQPKTLQYAEVKETIKQTLTSQKTQELYPTFYEELKQDADIKIDYVESAVIQ